MSRNDLTIDEYRALAEFRYQIRRFLYFSETAARDAGLNPQHHQVLLALKGLPDGLEATVSDIAERLHIRHHTAVELTNRLTRRGLIRKQQNRVDKRRVRLEITARGNAVLRKLSLIHQAQLESVGKDLIRTLRKLLTDNEGLHRNARSRKDDLK